MILNETNHELIKQLLNNFDVRADRVIARIHNGDLSIIPSRKYPLKCGSPIEVFTHKNTEKLEEKAIQKIYDGINFEIGKCYKNMKMLKDALIEAGITNFKTYVGWLFFSDTYPVHHCFIVYNDKYILDPSMQKIINELKEAVIKNPKLQLDNNAMRLEMVRLSKKYKNTISSKKSTFGKVVNDDICYVASECDIEEGEQIYIELVSSYPNHPSYKGSGMNMHGLSLTQQMIKDTTQ